MIGDSYVRGTGGRVGFGIGKYFSDYSGADVTVYANGGAGFNIPGNQGSGDFNGKTFVQFLQSLISSMSADERASYDHLMVVGGYNDNADDSYATTYAAADQFYTIAEANFPNAQLWMCPCYNADGFEAMRFYNAYNAMANACKAHGGCSQTESLWWFYGWPEYDAGDGVHLNEEGYKLASRYIVGWMNGGDPHIDWQSGRGCNAQSGITTSVRIIRGNHGLVTFTGSLSCTTNYDDKLYSIGPIYRPNSTIYVPAYMYKSGGNRIEVGMRIHADGNVRLAPIASIDSGSTIYFSVNWVAGM